MTSQSSVADRAKGQTIAKLLRRNAGEYGDLPALTSLDAEGEPTLTWAQVRHEVAVLSRGLADLGLGRGDRMLIMAPSCPEHLLVDLAAVHAGALPCTAYATLSPDQIRYVARHSAAPVVVLHGVNELKRWEQVLDDLPALRHVVLVDAEAAPPGDDRFVSLAEVRRRGEELHEADPDAFERATDAIQPSDPLAMIYTSGTTGQPKGVVLTHANAVHESYAMCEVHGMTGPVTNIAYLPLAHIAEREVSIYLPITLAGHVHTLADPSGIIGALGRVHPKGFFAVPRVWEKMVAGLKNMLASVPEERRTALLQANELLQRGYKLRDAGREVPAELAEQIAETDRTVLAPIRQMLGLDQLIFCGSGAAALPVEVLYFIAGLGVEIHEVWGLSETTGAVTSNSAAAFRAGTVGRAVGDTEIKVAEDGELLVRGSLVFAGYLREDGSVQPAVDDEGWYATGDIGTIDEDGFVRITDRKKELIITSGGKNIAPTRIEGLLKEHPLVGQAVAIGNDRPYVTALIVLDDEILPGWAAAQGIEFTDVATMAGHPAVREEIERAVKSANSRLARVEQIKRYQVISTPWTPESGELTPTLKLKRRIINDKYDKEIEALYAG
ncbi:long-chain acyl-CoA synthetase [Amycolatopsis bartoniae]|uniref:Acyl-CoA synthetase n=1 Tax=Amycolatopsis bartoniae TaxID=941986 RepID=A0A8H9IYK6_9PSEU|nr:AMP-dependent synthetase/ligase [Amycolatopsis bartoniae]MBB2934426.1 long-chain acyl-CoA synthetase [Amycolatopsis bartoniae]TVT02956.1 long-chain fatty acid--CoA ligase [Amycolatopsis bartoniae]GHF47448.1 long-chain acyl-CoA synthetase [Amycolatopsis bartoniae]